THRPAGLLVARRHPLEEGLAVDLTEARRHDRVCAPPGERVGGLAEEAARGLVHVLEATLGATDDHRIGQRIEGGLRRRGGDAAAHAVGSVSSRRRSTKREMRSYRAAGIGAPLSRAGARAMLGPPAMRHSILFLSLASLALASACGTRTSLSID